MSPENAKLVNAAITFCLLGYCLLIFQGKIAVKKRSDFLERNKKWLTILAVVGLIYPVYEILNILLKRL
jgi:hypothetical protein